MIAQIVRRLAEDERTNGTRYSIVVTGDHSTPVLFGDHSHEPVPFAIAHVRHIVEALGGWEQVRSGSWLRCESSFVCRYQMQPLLGSQSALSYGSTISRCLAT